MAVIQVKDNGDHFALVPGNEAIAEERGIPETFPRERLDVMRARCEGGCHDLEILPGESEQEPEGEITAERPAVQAARPPSDFAARLAAFVEAQVNE